MPNMPNAPLIYTVGVVRFPRVPGIGKYAGALLEAVRGIGIVQRDGSSS